MRMVIPCYCRRGTDQKEAAVLLTLRSKRVSAFTVRFSAYVRGGALSNNWSQGPESPDIDLMGV